MGNGADARHSALPLTKWWWVLLASAILGGVAGRAVSGELPHVYGASTTIFVGVPSDAPFVAVDDIDSSERLTRTYDEIIPEKPVLNRVVQRLGLPITWKQLQSRVRTVVEGRSERLIFVSATAASAEEAVAIVREIPDQLQRVVLGSGQPRPQAQVRAFVWERLEALERHILRTQGVVDDLHDQVAAARSGSVAEELRLQAEDAQDLLIRWSQEYSSVFRSLQNYGSPAHLEVLEPPGASVQPVSPNIRFNTAASAGAGLMIGLLIANGIEFHARARRWGRRVPTGSGWNARAPAPSGR